MLVGCGSNTEVATITITPSAQSLAAGQTAQFGATGTIPHGKHPPTNEDVTSQVTWASNAPAIATISATGVATAVSSGSATITASMAGATSATATITVTGGAAGATGSDILSLSVLPGTQSVAAPKQTSQFIAIGTTGSGATVDVTGQVAWTSSSTTVATVTSTGLATGEGKGTTTITAIATNPDKTVATGTATFTVLGGGSQQYTALTITPSAQSLSASGQTGQFIALGTSGSTGLQEDVTRFGKINWSSTIPTIASVSSSGLATGLSVGTTTITAVLTNSDNSVITATADLTITLTPAPEPLLSLIIIPSKITVGDLQDTGQFLAIGTYSTPPTVRDLTNSVKWLSSAPNVFPVSTNSSGAQGQSNAGVASAWGSGGAVIIAEATDPATGSIQTATAEFDCPLTLPNPNGNPPTPGSCYGPVGQALLSTLTVYNTGLNTTDWQLTAPSATGTPSVLHCGPGWALNGGTGGSVCTATYPANTPIVITAKGSNFGGWSYNCKNQVQNPDGSFSCTVTLTGDDTVGAIFN
jgi:Bacterial Ig-like domain (group 2)